jgi:anti-sigma B factor antagonist
VCPNSRRKTIAQKGSPPEIEIETRVVGGRTVLAVSGELDLESAAGLRSAVTAALDAGARELWIDLAGTEFMDSTGVHLLLDTQQRMRALGRRLAIICPHGPVRRVLEITRVDAALPIYDDRRAAHRDA